MSNTAAWKSIIKTIFFIAVIIVAGLLVFSQLRSGVTKNVDAFIYELPFEKGTKHRIVQGYGGLFSHRHIAALDFDMPEGTPVCAAREGVIYSYKDDSDESGIFPSYAKKANYIVIKHSDGSFGCYWHLKKDGAVVKQGPVARGQLIGYSGSTGFTLSAHLHFSVKRILNYEMNSFVQTKFKTTAGVESLKNGVSYERP